MLTRERLLYPSVALASIPGPVLWGMVALGWIAPYPASHLMAVGVLFGLIGVVIAPWLTGDRPLEARMADMLMLWTMASATAQLGWELPYVLLHSWIVGVTEADTWAWMFWAYGVADARYLIGDPFVVVMEGVTALLGGPLELWAVYAWKAGRVRAAVGAMIVIGATQWYGGLLYFGLEIYSGLAHINTAHPIDLWVKFVALNGLWLVMPVFQVMCGLRALEQPDLARRALA